MHAASQQAQGTWCHHRGGCARPATALRQQTQQVLCTLVTKKVIFCGLWVSCNRAWPGLGRHPHLTWEPACTWPAWWSLQDRRRWSESFSETFQGVHQLSSNSYAPSCHMLGRRPAHIFRAYKCLTCMATCNEFTRKSCTHGIDIDKLCARSPPQCSRSCFGWQLGTVFGRMWLSCL
jgi:hypothetical protein